MDAVALIGSLVACSGMVGAAALTAWRVDAAARRDAGPDDYFWLVFGGAVVIAGAGIVAGFLVEAWVAVAVGLVSSASGLAWVWRRHELRRRRAGQAEREKVWADLCRRHDAVVRRWADYDVDPAKAIAYPGMHAPGSPAVRPMVDALREAGAERTTGAECSADGTRDATRFAEAVVRLERTFAAAEHDVRAAENRRAARHRAVSGRP